MKFGGRTTKIYLAQTAAFTETSIRKAMTSAKFYLFDTGVTNALLGRSSVTASTTEFGDLFEQWLISEVRAFVSYSGEKITLNYWRSTSKFEVDLLMIDKQNHMVAIEIKGSTHISLRDYAGLKAFAEDFPKARQIMVVLDGYHQLENGVEVIHVFKFLQMLWNHEIMPA